MTSEMFKSAWVFSPPSQPRNMKNSKRNIPVKGKTTSQAYISLDLSRKGSNH